MNVINKIMSNIAEIIYIIASNPLIYIPIIIFMITVSIRCICNMIGPIGRKSNKIEETSEEDEYYKTLIEYGYSESEIEKIKDFNNER